MQNQPCIAEMSDSLGYDIHRARNMVTLDLSQYCNSAAQQPIQNKLPIFTRKAISGSGMTIHLKSITIIIKYKCTFSVGSFPSTTCDSVSQIHNSDKQIFAKTVPDAT